MDRWQVAGQQAAVAALTIDVNDRVNRQAVADRAQQPTVAQHPDWVLLFQDG